MKRTPFKIQPWHKRLRRGSKPMKRSRLATATPVKPIKRGKRLAPRGKSSRAVKRAAWQAEMMETYGPGTVCEWIGGCSDTRGLANAHRLKKTKITDRDEYVHGRAHLCGAHHLGLDEAKGANTHERMFIAITEIMDANGRSVTTSDSEKMQAVIERLGL